MLFTVYDQSGEMFEVAPHIAKDLIINHGWSPSPPAVPALPLFQEPKAAPVRKKAG